MKRKDRSDWLSEFEDKCLELGLTQPYPQDFWDTAIYLFNEGRNAEEVAKIYMEKNCQ